MLTLETGHVFLDEEIGGEMERVNGGIVYEVVAFSTKDQAGSGVDAWMDDGRLSCLLRTAWTYKKGGLSRGGAR